VFIEKEPDTIVMEPTESGVWEEVAPAPRAARTSDVVLSPLGELVYEKPGATGKLISQLPAERMAAGTPWDEIFEQIRQQEEGQSRDNSVIVNPGGGLQVVDRQATEARPLSKLPETRMAGTNLDDAHEVAMLDPNNEERWTLVQSRGGEVSGWTFYLKPPFQSNDFKFLTFRNPSRRNLWDLSPLHPNLDNVRGHAAHVIGTRMGDQEVAVLCGPGGEPAPNLAAVRGVAAKWMYYTSARMANKNPGFSL
jgi:hypothetical protein